MIDTNHASIIEFRRFCCRIVAPAADDLQVRARPRPSLRRTLAMV